MDLPSDSTASESPSQPGEDAVGIRPAGASEGGAPGGEDAAEKPRLVPSHLPRALGPFADRLSACLRGGRDPTAVIAELCARALRQPAELVDAAGNLLSGWFDGDAETLAKGVPREFLVVELERGSPILTAIIVRLWRASGQTARLERLADAVGNAPDRLQGTGTGQMLCRLAEGVALSKPLRAQRLIDLAKPLLAGTGHEGVLERAIDWNQAGEVLKRLDGAARDFWRARLSEADGPAAPLCDAPPAMLEELKIALEEMTGTPRVFARFLQPPPGDEKTNDAAVPTATPVEQEQEQGGERAEDAHAESSVVTAPLDDDVETWTAEQPEQQEDEPVIAHTDAESNVGTDADAEAGERSGASPDRSSEPPAAWAYIRGAAASPVTSISTAAAAAEISAQSPRAIEERQPAPTSLPRWNASLSAPDDATPPKRMPRVLIGLLACVSVVVGGIAVWQQKLRVPSAADSSRSTAGASAQAVVAPAETRETPAARTNAPASTSETTRGANTDTPASPMTSVSTVPPALPSGDSPRGASPTPATAAIASVLMKEPQSSPAVVSPARPAPAVGAADHEPAAQAAPVPQPLTAEDKERQQMKKDILDRNPGVARWHQRIVGERYQKVQMLLMGRETYLPAQAPEYAALLEALLLDPPDDATSREVVCKQAIRRLSPQEVVPLFEKAVYRGSRNGHEARDACSLLLELRREALGPSLAARVEALVAKVID